MLIALYVQDEWSYDKHHPNADRVYRISSILVGTGEPLNIANSALPVGPLISENFIEIESTTRMSDVRVFLSRSEEQGISGFYETGVRFVDSNFFDIFYYDWVQGSPTTALNEPGSIVLTESFAEKYFGDEDPMGQSLLLYNNLTLANESLKVVGIIKDEQSNSHISADAFLDMSTFQELKGVGFMENWFALQAQTYIRVKENVDFEQLKPILYDFIEESMPPYMSELFDPDSSRVLDIHLNSPPDPGNERTRSQDVKTLIAICFALLIIACINFVNLSTARSSERIKEIAMRKVLGSRRFEVFVQHMGESALLVLIALLVALGLTELSLPLLNAFTGKSLVLFSTPLFYLSVTALGMIVAILSGIYPSFYLSSFRPLSILREQTKQGNSFFSFRNILVITQFTVSIVLIIATSVMMLQVQYSKNLELGFNTEKVLVIDHGVFGFWETFKQQIKTRTSVSQVSAAGNRPFSPSASSVPMRFEGGEAPSENLSLANVDFSYFELFDVALLSGRTFSEEYGTDRLVIPDEEQPHTGGNFVLNRAMVERLGWTPENAVGKWFEIDFSQNFERSVRGEVIGVVENMHVDSVKRAVVPLVYRVMPHAGFYDYAFLKIPASDQFETLKQIDQIWSEVAGTAINRYFLDSDYQELYAAEEKQTMLVSMFALLTIVISCMGVFGLASFATQKRIKEIGIRKTLGASVMKIVLLLTQEFSKLVLISNLIAWPIAYFAMERWLENFAYRIDLTPVIFIGSGLIALCIAWVTVGGTAAKAASQKPVLALRYE